MIRGLSLGKKKKTHTHFSGFEEEYFAEQLTRMGVSIVISCVFQVWHSINPQQKSWNSFPFSNFRKGIRESPPSLLLDNVDRRLYWLFFSINIV